MEKRPAQNHMAGEQARSERGAEQDGAPGRGQPAEGRPHGTRDALYATPVAGPDGAVAPERRASAATTSPSVTSPKSS